MEFSTVNFDDDIPGSTAIYSCIEDYRPASGTNVSSCSIDETWSPISLVCKSNYIIFHISLFILKSFWKFNLIKYGRSTNLKISTYISVITCATPKKIPNTNQRYNSTTIGANVVYTCTEGKAAADGSTAVAECKDHGQWTHVDMECIGNY